MANAFAQVRFCSAGAGVHFVEWEVEVLMVDSILGTAIILLKNSPSEAMRLAHPAPQDLFSKHNFLF